MVTLDDVKVFIVGGGFLMIAFGMVLAAPANLILHIVLRKERDRIAWHIIYNAPDKSKVVLERLIFWNMSWIFSSTVIYTWLGLLLGKVFNKSTFQDARVWHQSIKEAYGKWRFLVYVMQFGFNLFFAGMTIYISFFIVGIISKQF